MTDFLHGDPSEPRGTWQTPDHAHQPPTLWEKIFTSSAVLFIAVCLCVLGYVYVDQEHYVSDDFRDGRDAIAPYQERAERLGLKPFKVDRECWDLTDGLAGRAYRHFIYGCTGVWYPPVEGD